MEGKPILQNNEVVLEATTIPRPRKRHIFIDNFWTLLLLPILSCYLYLKSFEMCNKNIYDCDLYYDSITIMSKLTLIVFSGIINALLLFSSFLNTNKRKILLAENVFLSTFYIIISYYWTNQMTFEYSGTLYTFSLVFTFTLLVILYSISMIPSILLRQLSRLKFILIMIFLKTKLLLIYIGFENLQSNSL
jgi:hypothetical protein